MGARAKFDDDAWDRNDAEWEKSESKMLKFAFCQLLEGLASQKFGEPAETVMPLIQGGYNMLWRMHLAKFSNDVLVRVPALSVAQFPEEKTTGEVAAGRFIERNTCIPTAQVYHFGLSDQVGSLSVGPFLIMQYIESHRSLSQAAMKPGSDDSHILDPELSKGTLLKFWAPIAGYLLELSQHHFPCIGSLAEAAPDTYSVSGRPITLNMDNMIRLANIPRFTLPPKDKTYNTASDWYVAMAEMHLSQLVFQHNDLVNSANDCRNKYVARQLFRRLAKDEHLSVFGFAEDTWSAQSKSRSWKLLPAPYGDKEFRLWCDDFRAGNVLLDKNDSIVALIDWEFTYVAPTQFALDPPWCLLLEVPEMWPEGIEAWRELYQEKLQIWLQAMEVAEHNMNPKKPQYRLSTYMRESWETGRFWMNYAARKSWAFDTIYWKYLDERFFGIRGEEIGQDDLWKSRLHILTEKEQMGMEPFVAKKMAEMKERKLVDDISDTEVKKRMAEVLFDS